MKANACGHFATPRIERKARFAWRRSSTGDDERKAIEIRIRFVASSPIEREGTRDGRWIGLGGIKATHRAIDRSIDRG